MPHCHWTRLYEPCIKQQVDKPEHLIIVRAATELQLDVTVGRVAEQARDGRMVQIVNVQRVNEETLHSIQPRQIYTKQISNYVRKFIHGAQK